MRSQRSPCAANVAPSLYLLKSKSTSSTILIKSETPRPMNNGSDCSLSNIRPFVFRGKFTHLFLKNRANSVKIFNIAKRFQLREPWLSSCGGFRGAVCRLRVAVGGVSDGLSAILRFWPSNFTHCVRRMLCRRFVEWPAICSSNRLP